jgi:hypothetical protein
MKIADLLTRCAIEIEAIAKEIYFNNEGPPLIDDTGKERYPFFDSDCISYLEQRWKITKKQVKIVSPNFFFQKDEIMSLVPLKNAHKQRQNKWNKAYQAVKHNRIEDLSKGNIENLLHALAALYLLNIYYKDKKLDLGRSLDMSDKSFGSDIFAIDCVKITERFCSKNIMIPNDNVGAVYVIKAKESEYNQYQQEAAKVLESQRNYLLRLYPEKSGSELKIRENIFEFAKTNCDTSTFQQLIEMENTLNSIYSNLSYEAVLNKNQIIYEYKEK